MQDKRTRIYLDDHRAVMVAETELIGRCWSNNRGTPLGGFLQQLDSEVHSQKAAVNDLLYRVGGKDSWESRLKSGTGWFLEKLGRFKLNDSWLRYSPLSRVVELEALAATCQQRISLWDNLDALAAGDPRLEGVELASFRDQSQRHLEELNTHRRLAAPDAFSGHQRRS